MSVHSRLMGPSIASAIPYGEPPEASWAARTVPRVSRTRPFRDDDDCGQLR